MSKDDDNSERNFIEAKMIIQEFHDDPTVFIVGTAPFGKLWFDQDKINQQYDILSENWHQEYGEKDATHCKKPRIINVLLDESDPMFNRYRDNIRDAQEKRQLEGKAIKETIDMGEADANANNQVNMVVEEKQKKVAKRVVAKKKKEKENTDKKETKSKKKNVKESSKEDPDTTSQNIVSCMTKSTAKSS